MGRYIALIEYDAKAKAFGAIVPDAPGCTAQAASFDEVHADIIDALREWAVDRVASGETLPAARDIVVLREDASLDADFAAGAVAVSVPVFLTGAKPVRVNISMDAGLVAAIDDASRRYGVTRSGFLAMAAQEKLATDR